MTARPVARLFATTPYGISVWVRMLYERFVRCRPLHRVAASLADMGLAISPGTLADSIKRFVPLFEPLAEAILARQNEAALRHGDETSWRVQAYRERGRSSRAWLWTSVSPDAVYYHIDPSRSTERTLDTHEIALAPEAKTDAIAAIYDLLDRERAPATAARVKQLIKALSGHAPNESDPPQSWERRTSL